MKASIISVVCLFGLTAASPAVNPDTYMQNPGMFWGDIAGGMYKLHKDHVTVSRLNEVSLVCFGPQML